MSKQPSAASQIIAGVVEKHDAELIELRRDIHAHPELSWAETRTTELAAARVEHAGWSVRRLPETGFVADLGSTDRWSPCAPTSTRCRCRR